MTRVIYRLTGVETSIAFCFSHSRILVVVVVVVVVLFFFQYLFHIFLSFSFFHFLISLVLRERAIGRTEYATWQQNRVPSAGTDSTYRNS